MFQVFRNAWADINLRKKLLFTLLIVVIFRLGAQMFVPFIDPAGIKDLMGEGTILNYLDVMTGGAMSNGTLFAMSITPYINASIIIQLLAVAIPALERLRKEGEEGRKKLTVITKIVSLAIALFQSIAYYFMLRNNNAVRYTEGFDGIVAAVTIVACFVAGASLIIWLGDQISRHGIGNGISMILFAGIISRVPSMIINLFGQISADTAQNWVFVPLILVIYVLMIAFVILMTNAERRIPVQYAKRVVGRKMYGGQSNHIPIKVAMAGVMPIIFASSIMALPGTIGMFFGVTANSEGFWGGVMRFFSQSSVWYAIIYFFLIIAFNYFYIAMQYNPVQIANDLKKNNGAIPGYRPGKPTSDFIHNSLSKVTLVGAIFLGIIAIFPIIFAQLTGLSGLSLGGTTILIVVGVALETVRALESQMMMRHHKGFLE